MSYTIGKEYHFSAAHRLHRWPETHKCHNLHGHNYIVRVIITGQLGRNGAVIDYTEMDKIIKPLIERLDHKIMVDDYDKKYNLLPEAVLLDVPHTTAEHLSRWFYERIMGPLHDKGKLESIKVVVKETEKTFAAFGTPEQRVEYQGEDYDPEEYDVAAQFERVFGQALNERMRGQGNVEVRVFGPDFWKGMNNG